MLNMCLNLYKLEACRSENEETRGLNCNFFVNTWIAYKDRHAKLCLLMLIMVIMRIFICFLIMDSREISRKARYYIHKA